MKVGKILHPAACVLAAGLLSAPAMAAETRVTLAYGISLGNLAIGRVAVEATFIDGGYAIALRGATNGISRIITDASATIGARGNYRGATVLPVQYEFTMTEGGITAEANMLFRNRNVNDLHVFPGLTPVWDRVDLTMAHVRGVVDPMSALLLSVGHDGAPSGQEACNRTIPVFDGWQRFDVTLDYDRTEEVRGGAGGYSGPSIVCHARYVPVAGHQPGYAPVAYMEGNERLEAWLMPVDGQPLMIPYQLIVGTEAGDLQIRLDTISYH